MQAKTEQQEPFSLEVVWTALRCWWMVAGPIAVCLACAAGYGVYALTPPNYTATAWIEIRDKAASIIAPIGIEDSDRFVANQLELIKSPEVIDQVAGRPEVASTPELLREANPVNALRKQLKIQRQGKSDYYTLQFTSQIPERAALIPNEVAERYRDTQVVESKKRRRKIIESLEEQESKQEEKLKHYRREIAKLAQDVGTKDPYGVTQSDDGPAKTVAGELNAQLAQAEVNHEFLKAEVAAEIDLLKSATGKTSKLLIDTYIEKDARLRDLIDKGEELRRTEQDLADAVNDPKKNPKVQARKKDIAKNKSDIERMRKTIESELQGQMEETANLTREEKMAELKQKVLRSERAVDFLRQRHTEELGKQKKYTGDAVELEFLKSDYERTLMVSGMVSERLYRMNIEPPGSDQIQIYRPAVVPKLPDQAIPIKKILMAAIGAFAVPFGCAVAYEVLHQRVNCRKQLESLDVPCTVTEIAALPSRSRALLSGRREDRLDLFIESVDGLRTSLMVPSGRKEVRVFAVTSAIPGEGKTSLSTQFALSLASATGEPTLLIDGDLRYPDLHNAFELELSPGLADVFDNTCPASEAIVKARGDNLFVLPAGELTGNPHRVTANGRFRELIGELRTHFKYIVIDTPPILPASEALVMAKAADATLLVARRDHSRLSLVKEASQKIVNSGSKFAGVVLSGVPSRDYQYRYGAYGYGAGRHS